MAGCTAITQGGTRCKGIAKGSSSYCYAHHPENAGARRRAARQGGKRGGRGRPQAELSEVKSILRGLAGSVLKGATDRQDAAVVGQLLNTVIRAISVELKAREQLELIERFEALEEALEQRKGDSRWDSKTS